MKKNTHQSYQKKTIKVILLFPNKQDFLQQTNNENKLNAEGQIWKSNWLHFKPDFKGICKKNDKTVSFIPLTFILSLPFWNMVIN